MKQSAQLEHAIPGLRGLIQIDYSVLVGRRITLYSDQFPGRAINARVISANDGTLIIDRSTSEVDCLVNNQTVVISVRHRGQPVSVQAKLKRRSGGQCAIIVGDLVRPLTQRRFLRILMTFPVRLALLPSAAFGKRGLSTLRWMETNATGVSSGGLQIELPNFLECDSRLVMNLAADSLGFPLLVVGRVRHCFRTDEASYQIGIEFVVNEQQSEYFDDLTLSQYPTNLFEYTEDGRNRINQTIMRLSDRDAESTKTGEVMQ